MHPRERAVALLREIGRATPTGIKGRLGRATRRFRSGFPGPLVTVVLAVSDAESIRIAPALDSLRGQTHRNLDICVVGYGPTERVRRVVAEHAAQDWRIRVLGWTSPDRASARNLGATRARGRYLLFVAGGDDVLPDGIARLVDSLESSASPMAIGMVEPSRSAATPSTSAPYDAAHAEHRLSTTLAESPRAITDLGIGNRMFLRSFWEQSGLAFPAGPSSDNALALASYTRAPRFDLLKHATYLASGRVVGATVGTMSAVLPGLPTWLAEHREARRTVEDLGLPGVMDAWLWGVLDAAVHPFIDDVERATEAEWAMLRQCVEEILAITGDGAWDAVRADSRVKLWLVLNDKRVELEEYVAARWFERGNRPTEVIDGRVYAQLPFYRDPEVGVPDENYLMTEAETPLEVGLYGVRWIGTETLELDMFARVAYVGLAEPPEIEAALVRGDERLVLPIQQRTALAVNQFQGHRYQDYSAGAFTARVEPAELAHRHRGTGAQRWRLEVRFDYRGVRRAGPVNLVDDRGTAGLLGWGHLAPRRLGEIRVGIEGDAATGIRVVTRPDPPVRITEFSGDGRRIRGRIVGADDLVAVRVSMAAVSERAPLRPDPNGAVFDLTVPAPWGQGWVWRMVGLTRTGAEVPLGWPEDSGPQWIGAPSAALLLGRNGQGDCELVEARDTVVLEEVSIDGDELRISGRWTQQAPQAYRIRLVGSRCSLTGEVQVSAGDQIDVRFPTTWDEWGLGATVVPTGRYWFELTCGPEQGSRRGRVLLGEELLERVLEQVLTPRLRYRPIRLGRDAGVFLQPPLAAEERGPFAQASLQAWALEGAGPVDPRAVYLQSYAGASATDSQLAIHHELRRTHPELTLYWGIADHSSAVPEGGVPVVMGTREWYAVMSTAGHLVMNIDFERWFHTRPGQRVLQTFHGYPAKSMGIRMWEAKNYSPRRIELELARTSGDWDLILTPAPEMDVYYRTEYRYDGPIHSAGYPRDDMLLDERAEQRRIQARARLGLRPGQKAILYAPTWRDDLASNWRRADMVSHLDIEAASAALGEDYVFLMRGHRFNKPVDGADSAQFLDVTTYPEINDLILAADAAVLDYSSLRFDFALTGRPMVFLVPDLADYTGGVRGFLYDYRDTAPGPLVDTAEEVVARLRDLPALQREFAGAIAAFNATYNYLQDGRAAERVVRAFFG